MGKLRRYIRDAHISLTDEQYTFVSEELNGGMAHHIRALIDAYRGHHNGELSELEREFPLVEAKYLSMKKRIEELKEETKRREDDLKAKEDRITDAHKKLLDSLKDAYWKPEGIQKSAYRVYADYTGLSVKELMDWVQEQAKRRDEIESE